MPKENTHLFFARKLANKFKDQGIKKIIGDNPDYYYLGSVAPDIFFYGKNEKEWKISAALHGKDGELSNKIVFQMLDLAKERKSEKDLAFAIGYLTHSVLDGIFHPVIIYLTGNIFSRDKEIYRRANSAHRQWETCLDKKINDSCFYSDLIKIENAGQTDYGELAAKQFDVLPGKILELIKKQALINRLIRSRAVYFIFLLLVWLGLYGREEDLPLSYFNLKNGEEIIPEAIKYRDFISGEEKETNLEKLITESAAKGEKAISAAVGYYFGKIGRKELEAAIPGESMETGKVNCPATAIKFFQVDKQ
ncbi:MAG: zinc dependent phospholipase C family protein [Patescibacteria group bacterium]|jgi:hypothetical protein